MFKTIIIFSISKLYVYYCCLSLMNETHNEVPQESNESYVDAPLKNIVPNFALNWKKMTLIMAIFIEIYPDTDTKVKHPTRLNF